jgi:hypothetical protein
VLAWLGAAGFWIVVTGLWAPPHPARSPAATVAPTRCAERWSEEPEVQPQQECWSELRSPSKRFRPSVSSPSGAADGQP